MDGYFDIVSTDSDSGDNEHLLEGICEPLHEAAREAFAAIDIVDERTLDGLTAERMQVDQWKDTVRSKFMIFSDADVDGLWGLIEDLAEVWNTLYQDSQPDLELAKEELDPWRGESALRAKEHLTFLKQDYANAASAISVLESDIVAAREAIGKARNDLEKLAGTFKSAIDQWVAASTANDSTSLEIISAGLSAGLAALLAVPTGGGSVAAYGAASVTSVAGSMMLQGLTPADKSVGGPDPEKIYGDFMEGITDTEDSFHRSMEELVKEINKEMSNQDLLDLHRPPDLSPGDSFDPDDFGTDRLPEETEDRVRDSGRDIPEPARRDSGGVGDKVR